MASIPSDGSDGPLEDDAKQFPDPVEAARRSARDGARDPLAVDIDYELELLDQLLDQLVEQAKAPQPQPAADEKPTATPVFTPGDVQRSRQAARQAGYVLARMLKQRSRVPRNGTFSSSDLKAADGQVAKAQHAYEGALHDQE